MTNTLPKTEQFRIELQGNGLVHLIFDCPTRSMNVFSNAAIHELGAFAAWLKDADVKGVVLRSSKDNAFCAGADLTELGVAYDMIVASRANDRFDIAYNHFFPLSHAIRKLETAGKPVAAAIGGIALGGGCELTMGAHYRVAVDSPKVFLGLPESAVGLLPGAGGTQRMPRLVGLEIALDVLLRGRNLSGQDAKKAGLIDELVNAGEEVAAAERWLLSDAAHAVQPWDRADYVPALHAEAAPILAANRKGELTRMLGHEPAPLAILDCVELGYMQPMDGAIRSEMSVFARLIQRSEARNMIQTLFLAKQAYDRAKRKDAFSSATTAAISEISSAIESQSADNRALAAAGFTKTGMGMPAPVQDRVAPDYWIKCSADPLALKAQQSIDAIKGVAAKHAGGLSEEEQAIINYAATLAGYPVYLEGVMTGK
ncbi:MAG: enoyl-CoA hydratase-related protein [Parasphingorhabdus sp.]|uniref:enoyl-CoA hydratase-related protein n=1 Tax=Parasphingorhabdus sp. TaxID=2709688 RepID=UPI0030030B00